MAEDYYQTLGLARNASADDIQKAYREMARKYHPDVNPDKNAKQKFQEVQRAFDVLGDAKKRAMYDRHGHAFDEAGPRGPQSGGRPGGAGFEDFDFSQFFGGQQPVGGQYGGDPMGGLGDIFSQFRQGQPRGGRRKAARPPTTDLRHELQISFETAVLGGSQEISLQRPSGEVDTIAVKIPAGIEDGKELRVRGQGEEIEPGGPRGNLLLAIRVGDHRWFTRRGLNLYVRVPVTLGEAAGGGTVDVPTPYGTVGLRVPACTSGGAKLRIKGHGIRPAKGEPGDLFAEIQVMLPKPLDPAEIEALKKIDEKHPAEPRQELKW
ncbi:MAG: DnaJ C-terminal domain-containing protein [Pirellulales bacterium]